MEDGAQNYWYLSQHCTNSMYPQYMPNLKLPSREARFYWQLYTRNGRQEPLYEINLSRALLRNLKRTPGAMKLNNMIIPPDLVKIKGRDFLHRKDIIEGIKNYIMDQKNLVSFSIEDLQLKRMEGVGLVLALQNSRKSLKYLYCWKAFERTEGPLLVDTGNFNGSGLYKDRIIRENEWLQAIGCLEALTTLSLNYAYIATPKGDFLIKLSKKIGEHWLWLQLLCIQNEIPIIVNANDGIGGYKIPDAAWLEAINFAPKLKVQFVLNIPEYDQQREFLSKSIPVDTMILSTTVQMNNMNPSMIDCTIKTLWYWFPQTLVHLALQLWHHRESLDSLLKKLFINLPKLEIFEFTGEIKNIDTLKILCSQMQSKIYSIKHIQLQLQKPTEEDVKEIEWKEKIINILDPFQNEFNKMDLKFIMTFYPM